MIQTITLASIYELQGFKKEAILVYKNILQKEPDNTDAKLGLRRLSGIKRKFSGVNENMKNFFINMDTNKEFEEFERWLLWK
jgi:hypothetical protein